MTTVTGVQARRAIFASWLRRGTVFIILLTLVVFFSLASDRFLQSRNLVNILVQNAPVIVMAVGMTMAMLVGGIDLSVGSVAALAGAISAGLIVRDGLSVYAGMLVGLVVGLAIGLLNGVLVVYGKLPPFVATLATMGIARGLTLVYTEGRPISGMGDAYTFWGSGVVAEVPVPVIVWLVIVALAYLLLTQTRFGLHVYAIGGGEETARLAGVAVNRVKLLTYGISGLLAGLAGLLLTARLWSAQPQVAVGFELNAIAAAVLGGVSLFGGVGSVLGAVVGALIVGVLGNGMNLLRVASYPQQVIQGIVLVLAVAVDMYTKRLENR
ncbi:MAG: ABC transporter permease [Anaerolineae bacterium]|nr:ABC transporter permease [Anaerolineae bacterium]